MNSPKTFVAVFLTSLLTISLTGSPAFAARLKKHQLPNEKLFVIQEGGTVYTCGLLRRGWRAGKLTKRGAFISFGALMRFKRKQLGHTANIKALRKQIKQLRTKNKKGKILCAPGPVDGTAGTPTPNPSSTPTTVGGNGTNTPSPSSTLSVTPTVPSFPVSTPTNTPGATPTPTSIPRLTRTPTPSSTPTPTPSATPTLTSFGIQSSNLPNGAIDARQPFISPGNQAQGWDVIDLTFNSARVMDPDDFNVTQFGNPGTAPQVVSVVQQGISTTYRITLSAPLTPFTWSQITYTPSDTSICLGFLPGDVNADGMASNGSGPTLGVSSDIAALQNEFVAGVNSIAPVWSVDINRSLPALDFSDISTLGDMLSTVGPFAPGYNGRSLPTGLCRARDIFGNIVTY